MTGSRPYIPLKISPPRDRSSVVHAQNNASCASFPSALGTSFGTARLFDVFNATRKLRKTSGGLGISFDFRGLSANKCDSICVHQAASILSKYVV
ncbi:hypothetical protein MRX96_041492 [Rhipicephalus microplus]